MRAPIPCIERLPDGAGCPEYAVPGKSRCEKHQRERERSRPRHDTAWKRARELALKLAKYRCRRCGKSPMQLRVFRRRLEVHHVDGDPTNHDQANLRVLCGPDRESCHRIEQRSQHRRA